MIINLTFTMNSDGIARNPGYVIRLLIRSLTSFKNSQNTFVKVYLLYCVYPNDDRNNEINTYIIVVMF